MSSHIRLKKYFLLLFSLLCTAITNNELVNAKNNTPVGAEESVLSCRKLYEGTDINNQDIKYAFYNSTNNILQIEYNYFIKKLASGSPTLLQELLKKTPFEKNKDSLDPVYKSEYELQDIIKILQRVKAAAVRNNLNQKGLDKLDEFFSLISEGTETSLSSRRTILRALYTITGNESLYGQNTNPSMFGEKATFNMSELNNEQTNQFLLVILWTFFSYSMITKTDEYSLSDDQDLLFLFSYPLFRKKVDTTYAKIRFNDSLRNFFHSYLATSNGLFCLHNSEKYPKAINEEMGYLLVLQKVTLLELLLDEDNKAAVIEIQSLFQEIANICKEIDCLEQGIDTDPSSMKLLKSVFSISNQPLRDYLRNYIPGTFFGFFGKHSSPLVYSAFSAMQFYDEALSYPLGVVNNIRDRMDDEYKAQKIADDARRLASERGIVLPETARPRAWFDNAISAALPQFIFSWSTVPSIPQTLADFNNDTEKYAAYLASDRSNRYRLFADTLEKFRYMDGRVGGFLSKYLFQPNPAFTTVMGGVYHLGWGVWATYHQFIALKNLLRQANGVRNYYRYFELLYKSIKKSKRLLHLITNLYRSKNIPEALIIPELTNLKRLFDKNNTNSTLLKTILHLNGHPVRKGASMALNFFFPGRMAHFYFHDLFESKELDILRYFIGSMDLAFAKIQLLKLRRTVPQFTFSIPRILNPTTHPSIEYEVDDMWYPVLSRNHVQNSLRLSAQHKNVMLVSPVAGGKTVFLSSLLTTLYLSYMGITPAARFSSTYFTRIVDHLEHPYEVGGGLSQHLVERQSMEIVKNTLENENRNEKYFVIIDEIYRGTRPDLAVQEAFIDLPPLLMHPNSIIILTTHFPEITELTKKPEYNIHLYYLLVDHFAGVFKQTYKVRRDDENNWWIRDPQLGLKYQLGLKPHLPQKRE